MISDAVIRLQIDHDSSITHDHLRAALYEKLPGTLIAINGEAGKTKSAIIDTVNTVTVT